MRRYKDVEVEALLFNRGLTAERVQGCGVPLTVIDESAHGTFGLLRRMVALLRRTRPDIVHTHGYKECVLGSIAALLAGGIPCARTVHGWVETRARFWQLKKILVRLAELLMLRGQRAVVAVSAELGSRLSRYLSKTNVVVIENGIEITAAQTATGTGLPPTSDTPRRIAIVGRLVPVKRIDLFLQVCRLLHDEYGSRVQFLVIGDGPLMLEIRHQVQELGLADRTRLLGFVPNVSQHIAGIDALLITSDHEGLPMTLLEAMAHHVPVVAHAIGGIPAVLEDGRCGWLVHRQEPRSYYEAVKSVLQNDAERKQKTASAYHQVVTRYSVRQTAQRYRELYQRVLARPGGINEG